MMLRSYCLIKQDCTYIFMACHLGPMRISCIFTSVYDARQTYQWNRAVLQYISFNSNQTNLTQGENPIPVCEPCYYDSNTLVTGGFPTTRRLNIHKTSNRPKNRNDNGFLSNNWPIQLVRFKVTVCSPRLGVTEERWRFVTVCRGNQLKKKAVFAASCAQLFMSYICEFCCHIIWIKNIGKIYVPPWSGFCHADKRYPMAAKCTFTV